MRRCVFSLSLFISVLLLDSKRFQFKLKSGQAGWKFFLHGFFRSNQFGKAAAKPPKNGSIISLQYVVQKWITRKSLVEKPRMSFSFFSTNFMFFFSVTCNKFQIPGIQKLPVVLQISASYKIYVTQASRHECSWEERTALKNLWGTVKLPGEELAEFKLHNHLFVLYTRAMKLKSSVQ